MTLTVEQAIQQAIDEHKAGNLQQAEHLYRAILQVQPEHPDAKHNMGVLALSVGKPSEAIPFFRAALDSFPDQPQFWISLIESYLLIGDHESAQTALSQARCKGFHDERFDKLEARIPVSLGGPSQEQIDRAVELYNAGMLNEAERVSIELTLKFPSHPFAWKLLGAVLHITGRKEAALAPMMKAARLSQCDAAAHSNLGVALKELGRLEDAVASYRKAIHIKPDFAKAHSNLGNALTDLGRPEDAVASYRKAIHIKPDLAEAHNNLGNALINLGRLEDAAAYYREAIRIKPNYAEAHSNLGVALKDLGHVEESETSYREAIHIRPDYAEAHYNLRIALHDLGRIEDAVACYREAIRIKPDYTEAHYNLGIALYDLRRLEDAVACYREAIRIKPSYAEAHCNLGNAFVDLGRLEDAEASYREAIRIKPDFAKAHSHLLFLLSYLERTSPTDYLNEAKRFGQLVTENARTKFSHWPLEHHPVRLRVGFVSGDLRNHPVGYFIEGGVQ